MAGDLPVGLVMVGDKGEQALLWLSLEAGEVAFKVIRKEDPVVVLEVAIKAFQDLAECPLLLTILNRVILEEAPNHPLEGSKDVQDGFTAPLAEEHLLLVKEEPLAVLTVLGWLAIEQRNVGVAQVLVVCALGFCSLRRRRWHEVQASPMCSGSRRARSSAKRS